VGVYVDKAGGESQTAKIDRFRVRCLQTAGYARDAVAGHVDIGLERRCAGTIVYQRITEQKFRANLMPGRAMGCDDWGRGDVPQCRPRDGGARGCADEIASIDGISHVRPPEP
jgi:hypothetical protein